MDLTPTKGGYKYTEPHGRESFIPDSLIFKSKSGQMYIHAGREVGEYPHFITKDLIRSVKTGQQKWLSEEEFIKFKTS